MVTETMIPLKEVLWLTLHSQVDIPTEITLATAIEIVLKSKLRNRARLVVELLTKFNHKPSGAHYYKDLEEG